jgi:hypothetical protein
MDVISNSLNFPIPLGFFLNSKLACLLPALLKLGLLLQQFTGIFVVLEYVRKMKYTSQNSKTLTFFFLPISFRRAFNFEPNCIESNLASIVEQISQSGTLFSREAELMTAVSGQLAP